ncbi:uncharacterized protein BDZ99DRAFT_469047, partial [Mytilinidion resinicola]
GDWFFEVNVSIHNHEPYDPEDGTPAEEAARSEGTGAAGGYSGVRPWYTGLVGVPFSQQLDGGHLGAFRF